MSAHRVSLINHDSRIHVSYALLPLSGSCFSLKHYSVSAIQYSVSAIQYSVSAIKKYEQADLEPSVRYVLALWPIRASERQ
ncbi:hypothetical protein [Marinibactrum halimedae]|uniref:Uncharacterized protein n=1 Tax=Marinibactrum halimedae TaxID=1444977 RepID=A0AA37WP08_9GAMM|nr:hypothetical protein [Marinibactrum halimedae]MCD9457588.1 hypothetical protein [Marinibactrum halimedae]GLS28008.1 hypothetical protein GCM10007877_37270 [Marinibactrum halimedae]